MSSTILKLGRRDGYREAKWNLVESTSLIIDIYKVCTDTKVHNSSDPNILHSMAPQFRFASSLSYAALGAVAAQGYASFMGCPYVPKL